MKGTTVMDIVVVLALVLFICVCIWAPPPPSAPAPVIDELTLEVPPVTANMVGRSVYLRCNVEIIDPEVR